MGDLLAIAIGGAIGALLRYSITCWVGNNLNHSFPFGTLSVNLLGCLAIGILGGVFENSMLANHTRLLLFIGLLGSFTTFSAFSIESFELLKNKEFLYFFLNIGLSVVLGLGLVIGGFTISKFFK